MARLPRLTIPGYPHHIVQRGNDRQPIFGSRPDYELLLDLLDEHSKKNRVAIHSYVLMSNHFHLLATPETSQGIPQMMQGIGRRYVINYNLRHRRTGTLWEGRYRSTLIQAERYLLACMVYIDLNPVRAGMVADPADYSWSSHQHYVGRRHDRIVTPHPLYWELGNTPFARDQAYLDLVRSGISPEQQRALTESVFRGWPLGEPDYVADLQRRTERRVARRQAGRPLSVNKPRSVPD